MSRKTAIFLLGLLTAINVAAVAIDMSAPSRAAVSGMDYKQLANDPDFVSAVRSVVERCRVNVDLGRLSC